MELARYIHVSSIKALIYSIGDHDSPFEKHCSETVERNQSLDHIWCGQGVQHQKEFAQVRII